LLFGKSGKSSRAPEMGVDGEPILSYFGSGGVQVEGEGGGKWLRRGKRKSFETIEEESGMEFEDSFQLLFLSRAKRPNQRGGEGGTPF